MSSTCHFSITDEICVWFGLKSIKMSWVRVMGIFRWLFLFSSIEATLIDEQQQFPDRTDNPGRYAARLTRTSCCFPCVREKKQLFTLSFDLVKVQDCCIFKFKEILAYILSYHPIQALTVFYFIGRIRFWLGLLFFLLLWGCVNRLLSFRKGSIPICPVS